MNREPSVFQNGKPVPGGLTSLPHWSKRTKVIADPAFVVWTFRRVKFLAFPFHGNFVVIDENNQNYGAWMTVKSFRDRQRTGGDWSSLRTCHIEHSPHNID